MNNILNNSIYPLLHIISLQISGKKKRRMEEINKVQKKLLAVYWDLFFQKSSHSSLKMLSFNKTDLCGHIPVKSEFSHTLFSHLSI